MIPRYPRFKLAAADVQIIVHANSVGAGVGASAPSKWWPAVANTKAPLAGLGITTTNRSVPGMGIVTNSGASTMTVTAPTSVDPLFDPDKLNVLVIHEFINELKGNGFNATAAITAWRNYCAARRAAAEAAGARLFIITMTTTPAGAAPAGEGQSWVDSRMAAIVQCNDMMRRDFRDYADALCDVAAYPPFAAMYQAGDWTPAAFSASGMYDMHNSADDWTHLGDAGYEVMATAAAAAYQRIR